MAAEDVPMSLRLVESFANSVDVDLGQDDLDSPARFGRWLADHGFPGVTPTADELALAIGLRGALRDELTAHHGHADAAAARSRMDEYAARIPMRAAFGAGPATFVPVGTGVGALLGEVLAAVVIAEREGSWQRLKICREDTCQWVFFDRSKNQSKTWCSMRVCGNRNKTRSYRSRQRSEG
ncbi:MAG TPA: CGNR zinc finger domain-containing protein [Actinoplanes sp.]|nr:CGNR zinc finger domain-containing protein [Actinoplanes sp.]